MKNRFLRGVVTLLVCVLPAIPASADAPSQGVVQEGVSVPGIELGATRAQAEAVYGEPRYCQSVTAGDRAVCTFDVTGGGRISIRYQGPEGGNAGNSPYDVLHSVRWHQGVNWVTSAGMTADIALNNPDALLSVYPGAEVTYHHFTGQIFRVEDRELGISITRWFNFYSGRTTVNMVVFRGQALQ